jgi:hypothetical protein
MKTAMEGARVGKRRTVVVFTVALVVVVAAVFGYLSYRRSPATGTSTASVGTVATPGVSCEDPSLSAAAAKVEADSRFTQLSDGLCYNFVGVSDTAAGTSGSTSVYTFDYYDGSVFYPCGTFPQALVASQIQADVLTNGSLLSVQNASRVNGTSALNSGPVCGPNPPPVSVVSAQLVEVTIPAVLEVNLTLDARSAPLAVTQLTAVIVVPGGNQAIAFTGVTPGRPLSPGRAASQISIITGPASLVAGGVYDMAIDGRFQGGQTFAYTVQIALVNS